MENIDLNNTYWDRIRGYVSELRVDARWILRQNETDKPLGSLRIVSHPDLRPGYLRSIFTQVTSIKPKTKEEIYKAQFKLLRSDVKNNLVFKLFYGGGKKGLATHYLSLGMSQEAMDAIYNKFWEVYSGVKKWQEEIVKFYNENGYSKSLTGRKRRYPLSYNEIINFPIQSTASFDICIVAGNYLSDIAVTKNLPQLQYRINIHDDLTFYIPEKTLLEDIITIGYNMVYPRYDFINVPLEVEYSIGTNWGNMIDTGKINTNEFFNYNHINNIWINREEKLPPLMRKAIRAKEINNTKEIII